MQITYSFIFGYTFSNLDSDQEGNLIQDFIMSKHTTEINFPQAMLKTWPEDGGII